MQTEDLAIFVRHQRDVEARVMAAFTSADPDDVAGEVARWVRNSSDPAVLMRTVRTDDQVVGHVVSFEVDGHREVSYWIDRAWWGRGVASTALRQLLALEPARPLHARVAADNLGSLTVLRRNGFRVVGRAHSYAAGRGQEVDELLLLLDP